MTYREFQQRVLALAADSEQRRVTPASAALALGTPADRTRQWLDQLVVDGLFELDSFDDGTVCYHAAGLQQLPTGKLQAQRAAALRRDTGRLHAAWVAATIVSVLDLVGVGVAALIVYPKWESELLMWIALGGAPLTLVALVRLIQRRVTPEQPER